MAEVGVLRREDRVELIEGQLIEMSPNGPRHALAIGALNELLVPAVAGRSHVRVQLPIRLDDYSEPEPDFALVRRPWSAYPDVHPGAPDVLLLIEVADSSLDYDRGAKLELYARAGIREFWVVDVTTSRVLAHRKPNGEGYGSTTTIDMSGVLQSEALPDVTIPVSKIFI